MRGRMINWRFVAPLLVYAAVAVAMVVAIIRFDHHTSPAPSAFSPHAAPDAALQRELRHCASIGAEAAHDPSCLAAWAENRRRFFGTAPAQAGHANPKGSHQP